MSYLKFEKALMTNLEESLSRELLRTNRSGAYSCSTIVDCNTSKYHGLLVVPVPEIDEENHVLLSSMDVTVIQHGAEFNLGLHKYQGNNYSPKGHKYIREFNCDKVPTTIYRVGGVLLRKEVVFQHYENRILIRYTLVDAHSETVLRFKPFLAFRSVNQLTHENSTANREFNLVDNGIKTCMYAGYPDLYMQFSKDNQFIFSPDWYRGIEYPKEQENGYASNEDLYVPGYFEMNIKKGESIVFAASTSEIKANSLKRLFEREVDDRSPRDNFFHCLVNAAHQFHNRTSKDERYIVAGYPWFKCRARDTFISLPGLTLAIDEQDYFELVMKTAEKGIREFMENRPLTVKITELEQPDVLFWAIWAIQQYAKSAGDEKCLAMYGTLVKDILCYVIDGKHPNLRLDPNGLIYTEGRDKPVTWMNSTVNGHPVVPRTGYIVEFNALWYNALKLMEEFTMLMRGKEEAKRYTELAKKCKKSFNEKFYNKRRKSLYDVLGDSKIRPNQLFALSLSYPVIEPNSEVAKEIINTIEKKLLTPYGLRTLAKREPGYTERYEGDMVKRDMSYHQGVIWPWLLGLYYDALRNMIKTEKNKTKKKEMEKKLLDFKESVKKTFTKQLTEGKTVGSICELYDIENKEYISQGTIAQCWSVAEVFRIIF